MRKIYATILLLFIVCTVNGQESKFPDVVPVSPNAASLGIFGSIPVGHYTGVPNVTVPLYEIDLDGLKIPISLSYHASGIKVAQEASWVGLGWALNAGGCITRETRGLPDFPNSMHQNGVPYYGYYFNNADYQGGGSIKHYDASAIRNGSVDIEPDLYYYNFGTNTGCMFVNRSQYWTTVNNTQVLNYTPKASFKKIDEYLDATVFLNLNTTPWVIVDGQGYKYYFGWSANSAEKHTLYSQIYMYQDGRRISMGYGSPPNEITDYPETIASNDTYAVPMTWYLDSIVSPWGNKIEFQYTTDVFVTPFRKEEKQSVIRSTKWWNPMCYSLSDGYMNGADLDNNIGSNYTQLSYSHAKIFQKLLKKIIFPSGTIEFSTSNRNDLFHLDDSSDDPYGEIMKSQKLEKININNNSEQIKTIQFHYSYLGNQGSFKACRLLLDGIDEKNGNQTNSSYRFEYNRGELPPKYSKNIDHWGYYNKGVINQDLPAHIFNDETLIPAEIVYGSPAAGIHFYNANLEQSSTLSIPIIFNGANRNSNAETMQYGMLTSIQYPTGGKSRFVYESHTFDNGFKSGIEKKQLCSFDSIKIDAIGTIVKTFQLDDNALVCFDLSVYQSSANYSGANRAYLIFENEDGNSLSPYDGYDDANNYFIYGYPSPNDIKKFPIPSAGSTHLNSE